ncbi:hypothetical protein [Streptomyces sp. NPDC001880]
MAKEHGDGGDDAGPVGPAERLVGMLDLAQPVDRLHERDQVGTVQLVEAVDVRALGVQPQAEAAQPSSGAGHTLRPQHQGAFGEEAFEDGVDARFGAQPRRRDRLLPQGRPVGDAGVEQGQAGAEGVGRPGQLEGGAVVCADDLEQAGDAFAVADGVPQLLDVVTGERVQVRIAAVQGQPDQAPGNPESLIVADMPERQQALAQPLAVFAQRQPELIGDMERLEHTDAQQPAPVHAQSAGESEVGQVVAGVEVDPSHGRIEAGLGSTPPVLSLAVAPAQTFTQRLREPDVQVRVGLAEAQVELGVFVSPPVAHRQRGDEGRVLRLRAVPGSPARGGVR